MRAAAAHLPVALRSSNDGVLRPTVPCLMRLL
jgi:hypothetical protein